MKRKLIISTDSIIWALTVVLFTSFFIFETSTSGSLILLSITILILILNLLGDRRNSIIMRIDMFQKMQIPFILFCFLSTLWSINASYAIEKGITLIEIMICMTVLFSYYSKDDNCVDRLLSAVMVSGFFTTLYTFLFYGVGVVFDTIFSGTRLASSFTNTNSLGMLAAISVVIASYYILFMKKRMLLIMMMPSIILISATGSRKALLLFIIGISIVVILRDNTNNSLRRIAYILGTVVLLILLIYFASKLSLFAGINERMSGMLSIITRRGEIDSSALLRQKYIQLGLEQFKKTPILGIGIGNPRILTYQYYGHNAYLHNNFVELLCAGGIIGFACYYLNYVYFLSTYLRNKRNRIKDQESVIIFALIFSLLMIDYGAVTYYDKSTYFYFMIFYLYFSKANQDNKVAIKPVLS